MTGTSAIRDANAIQGYIVEEIKRQLVQARTADFVARSDKALAWVDQISSDDRVILIELLVQKRLGTQLPELEVEIALLTDKVGQELSRSIAGYIDAVIEGEERAQKAAAEATPSDTPETRATETRTVLETADGVAVREIVKGEVAAFHRTMHKGVWSESARYQQGQMVTRGGSMWSCQKDGATGRPGDSADWLLIVKAGRDGRK